MTFSSVSDDALKEPDTCVNKATKKFTAFRFMSMLAIFTLFTLAMNSLYYQQIKNTIIIGWNDLCSGHGTVINSGDCVCDLGYNGQYCDEIENSMALNEVVPSSVAIFTDAFGTLNSFDVLSLYYESLAKNLQKSGHVITIVYTGDSNSQFTKISGMYEKQGIKVIKLEFEPTVEKKSISAYNYLRSLDNGFSTVIFSSSSHTGFYTLNSVNQRLFNSNTKFVLSLDDLSEKDIDLLQNADKSHTVTDISVLKKHFMTRKSIELANQVISPTESLISFYNVKAPAQVLPHASLIETSSNIAFNNFKLFKEIVFIGGRNNMDGIAIFCDSIDEMIMKHPEVLFEKKITFFLFDRDINGLRSMDYIGLRASSWETANVEWVINIDRDYQEMVQYFDNADRNRIAVIPGIFGGAAIIKEEFKSSGIQMITSEDSIGFDAFNLKQSIISQFLTEERSPNNQITDYLQRSTIFWDEFDSTDIKTLPDDNSETPLVSVILVHHNRPELLKQAVSSLEKQTYSNFEVVLVDDGSTDAAAVAYLDELSWKWWEEKGWKVIREPNRYLGASRNTGVKHANGKYVLFMDDDDYAKPHQIETFVKVALATKAPVITSGHDVFNGRSTPSGRSSLRYTPIGNDVLSGMLENVFGDSAMFIEREYFIESGGFTEEFGVGFEDYEYLAKVALRGDRMEAIAEPLHWYRIHQGTMSESTNLKANQLRVLRTYSSYKYSSDSDQKNLLLHVRDTFFQKGELLKRDDISSSFSSIFSNVTDSITSLTPEVPGIPEAPFNSDVPSISSTSSSSAITSVPTLDMLDPKYLFNQGNQGMGKTFKNVEGIETERFIVITGNNFGSDPILNIESVNGTKKLNLTIENGLIVKRNRLNPSQNIIVINQTIFENYNEDKDRVFKSDEFLGDAFFHVYNNIGRSRKSLQLYYLRKESYGFDNTTAQLQYMYNGSIFLAKLWVERLPDTQTPLCLLKEDTDPSLGHNILPTIYDRHSGQLLCAPKRNFSGRIIMGISASPVLHIDNSTRVNDYLAMISLNFEPFTFQYQDSPPTLLSAKFDNSGVFVAVSFDKSIFIRGEENAPLNCTDVFINRPDLNLPTLSVLNTDCIISRIDPRTIKLTFARKFLAENSLRALKPFDRLYLKNFMVYNLNNPDAKTGLGASGSVIVQPLTISPVPSLNIQSSPIIGACSDLVLVLSSMSGSGGRAFVSISISVTPISGGYLAVSSAIELEQILNKNSNDILLGKISKIVIGPETLSGLNSGKGLYSGKYSISVTLVNVWGEIGTKSYSFTFINDKTLPNVLFTGPGSTGVDSRKDNSIFAQITMSSSAGCSSLPKMSYKFSWVLNGVLNQPITSKGSSLLIKPFSLQPSSSYSASLEVFVYLPDEVKNFTYSYDFATMQDYFTTSLGSDKQIGVSQSFNLIPEVRNDYYKKINYTMFTYTWTCNMSGSPCKDSNGANLVLDQFVQKNTLQGNPFLRIPADKLSVGKYVFQVNAVNQITNTVGNPQSSLIEVVDKKVPDVLITSNDIRPSTQNQRFEIKASVARDSVSKISNVEFYWASEPSCGSKIYNTVSMDNSNLVTSRYSPVLKFKRNVLSPGSSYCLSLNVTDKANQASSLSFFIFSMRSRPTSGLCTAGNSVDDVIKLTSFVDDLSFNCASWITDEESYPLLYTFELQKKGSLQWVTISRSSPDPSIQMAMTEGEYTVRAIISDSSGSSAESPISYSVVVTQLDFGSFGLRKRSIADVYFKFLGGWLANKSEIFQNTQNINGMSSALSTISTVSFDAVTNAYHQTLQRFVFEATKSMIDSGLLIMNEDSVNFFASQIQLFTGTKCLTPLENRILSLDLLEVILEDADTTTYDMQQSLKSETLDKIVGTLTNLTCTSRANPFEKLHSNSNALIQKVAAISLRRAGCGEVAYDTSYSDLAIQIGRGISSEYLESEERKIGSFTVKIANELLDSCPSYITGKKGGEGLRSITKKILDKSVYQMSYLNDLGSPKAFSGGNSEVKFEISLSNVTLLQFYNPECSFVKYKNDKEDITTADLSQEGCITTGIDMNGKITCICNHLSDFLISFSPLIVNVSTPTASPSPEGNNNNTIIAAAVGGSIGAILIIGAALYVGLKVLPKRSKYSPGAESEPPINDQVMIGIPGPSNEAPLNDKKGFSTEDVKNANFS